MDIYTIGRKDSDIVIQAESSGVSKRHAEFTVSDDGRSFYLVDCGSANGTFVHRGGEWVKIKQDAVRLGDKVRFGICVVRVSDLVNRLPRREAPNITEVHPPGERTVLVQWLNPDSRDLEYRPSNK